MSFRTSRKRRSTLFFFVFFSIDAVSFCSVASIGCSERKTKPIERERERERERRRSNNEKKYSIASIFNRERETGKADSIRFPANRKSTAAFFTELPYCLFVFFCLFFFSNRVPPSHSLGGLKDSVLKEIETKYWERAGRVPRIAMWVDWNLPQSGTERKK